MPLSYLSIKYEAKHQGVYLSNGKTQLLFIIINKEDVAGLFTCEQN